MGVRRDKSARQLYGMRFAKGAKEVGYSWSLQHFAVESRGFMAEIESSTPRTPTLFRGRLPSPGCLLAITLFFTTGAMGAWLGYRVYERQTRIHYFKQFDGKVGTEAARPVCLHDLAAYTLGKEQAAGFRDITGLYLPLTDVTDADLQYVRDLTRLQELTLDETQITDAGLQHLSDLPALEAICLDGTAVTDSGLRHLPTLPKLKWLSLNGTRVTDGGVESLIALTDLELLELDDTAISDAGLRQLGSLKRLESLSVVSTRVTRVGIRDLERQLPGCTIYSDTLPLR